MKELWKDVVGYEDYFQISNLGRVFSKRTNKILKFSSAGEYLTISTKIGGKKGKSVNLKVHRMVAIAFVENADNKPMVNHIDGNKKNNNASNLEWTTNAENIQHAVENDLIKIKNNKSNMSMEKARLIRRIKAENKITAKQIAEDMNICYHTVKLVLRNETWKE